MTPSLNDTSSNFEKTEYKINFPELTKLILFY